MNKSVSKRSNVASKRYGKTLTQKNQTPVKPKTKVRPKGNPLKGVYGFKAEVKF